MYCSCDRKGRPTQFLENSQGLGNNNVRLDLQKYLRKFFRLACAVKIYMATKILDEGLRFATHLYKIWKSEKNKIANVESHSGNFQ